MVGYSCDHLPVLRDSVLQGGEGNDAKRATSRGGWKGCVRVTPPLSTGVSVAGHGNDCRKCMSPSHWLALKDIGVCRGGGRGLTCTRCPSKKDRPSSSNGLFLPRTVQSPTIELRRPHRCFNPVDKAAGYIASRSYGLRQIA